MNYDSGANTILRKLVAYNLLILLILSLDSYAKAKINPTMSVNLAYYKSRPHFFNLEDEQDSSGALFNYLSQIAGPAMGIRFNFFKNIPPSAVREITKVKDIDIMVGVFKNKHNLSHYSFPTPPFFLSRPIFFIKNSYKNKFPKNWTLGHFQTKKEMVSPFINKLAPHIFFLSPKKWIQRGLKMLSHERIHVLFDIDKIGASIELAKFSPRSNIDCIDLPSKPIPFYLGFNKNSKQYEKLIKKFTKMHTKIPITYNDYLKTYITNEKLSIIECGQKMNFFTQGKKLNR